MFSFIRVACMLWFSSASGFDRNIGATRPLGFFDPLGFSHDKPMSEWVRLREAELKHCRWGMVASVAIPTTELVTHQPAIYALDDAGTFAAFVAAVAVAEARSLKLGWKNPFENASNLFVMDEFYQPGDLDIDTFIKKDNPFMANAEINNGRLAMISAIGMMTQELLFGNIFGV